MANDNADINLDIVYIGDAVKKSHFGTTRISDPITTNNNARSVKNLLKKNNTLHPRKNKATLVNYSIFRDGEEIGQTTDSTYTDLDLDIGTYTYYVVANYTSPDGSSEPSNEVEIEIIDPFPAPIGLNASVSNYNVQLNWNEGQVTFEDGFESGDLLLWDEVIEGSGTAGEGGYPYWYVLEGEDNAYEGIHSAFVNWGYNLDTWMITPKIIVTENTFVSFFWNSSYYWHVDPNDNGDLFVNISSDNGETWETLWTFGNIGVWENWTWYETTIELSEYAGSIINIAFNLVANDNADVVVDNVLVDNTTAKINTNTQVLSRSISTDPLAKSISTNPISRVSAPINKATLSTFGVFRDDSEIAQTAENNYLDEGLALGTYTYYVVANYIDPVGTSLPSNEVVVEVKPSTIDPPMPVPSIMLYPNPSQGGVFHIDTDRAYHISVMNVNGIVIDEIEVRTDTKSLDLSPYGEGLYILHFQSDKTTFILKVLVE